MLLSLAIAGLVAVAVFVTTFSVVVLQRRENAATQREFDKYKLDTSEKIAQANTAGDVAKAEAAKANATAESERLARTKLEAKLAPRRLAEVQQQEIATSLIQYAGKTVRLESYGLDAESAVLAFQIRGALQAARINVDGSGLMTRASGGSIALGVHVTGRDTNLVHAILAALSAEHVAVSPDEPFPQGGISFGTVVINPTQPDAIVFVGIKPITE